MLSPQASSPPPLTPSQPVAEAGACAELAPPDLPTHLLPKLLQAWVAAIGIHPTMLLVQEYGGFRLYMPKKVAAEHPLAKLLGLATAKALVKAHGQDSHVLVPKAKAALLAVRDAKIMREYGPKTAVQLAREHGLSEPAIWRVVERHTKAQAAAKSQAAAARQPALFEL